MIKAFAGHAGRKHQRIEIWQKLYPQKMDGTLAAEGYRDLMPSLDENQTAEERKQCVKEGRAAQLALRRKLAGQMWKEATDEEKAEVEKIYLAQESKGRKKGGAEEKRTPEDFQK